MTDPIRTLLARVEELDWRGTEGPWAAWTDQDGAPHMNHMLMVGNADAVIPDGEDWVEGVDVNPVAHTYTPEDRALIAEYRTLAPQLARALEAVLDVLPEGDHTNPYVSDLDAGGLLLAEDVRVVLAKHLGADQLEQEGKNDER